MANNIKIDKIKLTNYKFFNEEFELPVDGKNILLYGENGSGKSSIYKALELLTQKKLEENELQKSKNVFSDEDPILQYKFSTDQEYIIDTDTREIAQDYINFLHSLTVFVPMLDYKKLLKVHYNTNGSTQINLYSLFRTLLKDYEYENNKRIGDIRDPNEIFSKLTDIMNNELIELINKYLIDYFYSECKIENFKCFFEVDKDDETKAIPIVNISIDYKENEISEYHNFFNEARLSELAISIYFSVIKMLYGKLSENSFKILVLDDLLISLDMNNRMKLLEILKNEFTDFQIFFFTHDRSLFEIYKEKLNWKKYELFLDDNDEIPRPILKQGKSELERAKEFYSKKEFDVCANLLRKSFEKILKRYLTTAEKRDRHCNDLDLSGLIDKAISKSNNEYKEILQKLNSDRQHILNPLSHSDDRNVFSEEIKSVIVDLEKLHELRQ